MNTILTFSRPEYVGPKPISVQLAVLDCGRYEIGPTHDPMDVVVHELALWT